MSVQTIVQQNPPCFKFPNSVKETLTVPVLSKTEIVSGYEKRIEVSQHWITTHRNGVVSCHYREQQASPNTLIVVATTQVRIPANNILYFSLSYALG